MLRRQFTDGQWDSIVVCTPDPGGPPANLGHGVRSVECFDHWIRDVTLPVLLDCLCVGCAHRRHPLTCGLH